MASDSVYRIVDVVGVSEKSWEDAGRRAVETAAGSLRDLRVAEVTKMDMRVEDGKVTAFRTRVALSFKYESCKAGYPIRASNCPVFRKRQRYDGTIASIDSGVMPSASSVRPSRLASAETTLS